MTILPLPPSPTPFFFSHLWRDGNIPILVKVIPNIQTTHTKRRDDIGKPKQRIGVIRLKRSQKLHPVTKV